MEDVGKLKNLINANKRSIEKLIESKERFIELRSGDPYHPDRNSAKEDVNILGLALQAAIDPDSSMFRLIGSSAHHVMHNAKRILEKEQIAMDAIDPRTVDDYLDVGLDLDDCTLLQVDLSNELIMDEADRKDFQEWLNRLLDESNYLGHISLIRQNIRLKVMELMETGKIRRKLNPPLLPNQQPNPIRRN